MQPLLGQSQAELTEWVTHQGQPPYRGQQLYQWLYQRGIHNLSEISVFPKSWRETIANIPVGRSQIHHRVEAEDGTVKYLLTLADGEIVETVGIPSRGRSPRLTVCVSSQVGCPMGCDFCATAKGGWRRNLLAAEIIDQVLTVQEDFGRRVSHLVFMGMGEPLLNIEAVLSVIRCLNQDIGIAQRSMTVSTVGIAGQIRRLGQRSEPGKLLQFTLAVSLHSPSQSLREKLIPSAKAYPLSVLLQECRDYVTLTHRRISFEYILLAGLNDRPEQARELAQHLRGFQSHVNLIPYNPIAEVDYQRPDDRAVQEFLQILQREHITSSIRYSRGLAANAACGQLRRSRIA